MLITDDFVMLNFPKTGSSFARKVIEEAYKGSDSPLRRRLVKMGFAKARVQEIISPKIDEIHHQQISDQHGTWRQIPEKYSDRPIVSVTRNPLSRYISTYHYGWWRDFPPASPDVIREHYPKFPDLDFVDYYEMIHDFGRRNRLGDIETGMDLGLHTIQFIQFYFRHPDRVLAKIDPVYIENKRYLRDMANIRFIEQDDLRSQLKAFLLEMGRTETDLGFLDSMNRVNVTHQEKGKIAGSTLSPDDHTRDRILARDKLIFSIFPDYLDRETDNPDS